MTSFSAVARGKRRGRRLCGAAALACALLLVGTGVARAEAGSSADGGDDAKYRSVLKDALAEYDAGHFEEARILFRRAHEIYPNARTLRSIGMASFELRDYVTAVRSLTAALSETRKALSTEQRNHAQGLLERSLMFVDIDTLKVTPTDARILIDGHAPEFEPNGTLILGFGSHTIEASRAGFLTRSMVVGVKGGDRKDLTISLERKPPPQKPVVLAVEVPKSSSTSLSKSGHPVQTWHPSTPWLLAAGGAALASASAGGFWLFYANELNDCRHPPTLQVCKNKNTLTIERNVAAGATLVTGAAAVTMALIGILSWDTPALTHNAPCTVVPNGILCSKSF